MSDNGKAITTYMRNDKIVERFAEVLGERNAGAFISSVLIAVRNNDALMNCTPESIMLSAMRAATLRLSCDPATGHAWLLPFKGKCTFIPGYRGYIHMALRTGQYRALHVGPIDEGMEVYEDPLTGLHSIEKARTGTAVQGYIFYMEMISGFRKTIYMTVDEIKEHAKKYSKSWGHKDSPWTTHFEDMAKKTVIRQAAKWMYFDPDDSAMLSLTDNAASDTEFEAEGVIDAPDFQEIIEEEESQKEPRSEQELLEDMGF